MVGSVDGDEKCGSKRWVESRVEKGWRGIATRKRRYRRGVRAGGSDDKGPWQRKLCLGAKDLTVEEAGPGNSRKTNPEGVRQGALRKVSITSGRLTGKKKLPRQKLESEEHITKW